MKEFAATTVVDAIDVVGTGERITVGRAPVPANPLGRESVHADVDPGVVQRLDPCPQAVEIGLVVLRQVEFRRAVGGGAGTGPLPRMRTDGEIRRRTGRGWKSAELWQFDIPQQREVVPVRDEDVDVGVEVQRLQRPVGAPVLEVVPGVGAVQNQRGPARVLEIVGIGGSRERPMPTGVVAH